MRGSPLNEVLAGAGAIEGELEAGKRALPPRNGASRRRGTIAVRSRCGCAWRPPFPIDRHLGASPQVAPDYWSRRGLGRFKGAGEGWGRPAAAGMVNNFHLPSGAADPEGTYGA